MIFFAVIAVALAWSATTNHVWEDFYITFRSSRNLATGHGLVFNQGERLHTFTSPLGVLLPALAFVLTGNSSDEAAIWIFRLMGIAALGGSVLLLVAVARRQNYGGWAVAALSAVVALDGKTIDFTTNGMETGFLLLFIAYALWAMFTSPSRRWLHLGLAWGGLMWTRPDGFLYIGFLSAGVYFFNDPVRTGLTRGQWLKLFLQAGLVCTAVYLPWFAWSWWYYGTPVPHTITAKAGTYMAHRHVSGALKTLVDFPLNVWHGKTSLEGAFLPSYYQLGGWPGATVTIAQALALVLAFQWVLPWWRVEVRVASFVFCGIHVYLSYYPYFPFPWYMPGTTLLAAMTLGGMIAQLLAATEARWFKTIIVALALVGLGAEGWLTWQMRREMALEQVYSATGVRRKAGEWLHDHARPGDTVFMEPLGHIGYFSGLRTYDYPGLSSREMVDAVHALGTDAGHLVEFLCPDWLALRPWEYPEMRTSVYRLFGEGHAYRQVTEFNNLPQVQSLSVYGRRYIEYDSHMMIFQRQTPKRYRLDPTVPSPYAGLGLPVFEMEGRQLFQVHATGIISFKVPANLRHFRIGYALPPGTYTGPVTTDGVKFSVIWMDGLKSATWLDRTLDPVNRPGDRGIQWFDADLPAHDDRATIILMTLPGATDAMDWSCWGLPEVR